MSLFTSSFAVYLSVSSSPIPPTPSTDTAASLAPTRSRSSCYHKLLATHATGIRTISSHMSIIVHVAMYCAAVLCFFKTYPPISLNPASYITVSSVGYYQLPSNCLFG